MTGQSSATGADPYVEALLDAAHDAAYRLGLADGKQAATAEMAARIGPLVERARALLAKIEQADAEGRLSP